MIKFNLLPDKEKKELRLNIISQWFAFFCASLLILAIVFTLLCLNNYFYLSIIIKAQQNLITIEQQNAKTQQIEEIEGKIKKANQDITKIDSLQSEFICWTPILEEIAEISPTGVNLSNFTYSKGKEDVSINGLAGTRDNFLDFKESLETSSLFFDIDSPLSNLTKKTDINFSLNFKINTSTPSCLKVGLSK